MPDSLIKKIKLDLKNIPKAKIPSVKREVGDFLLNEVFRNISKGASPVSGETFKSLDKDYAAKEKQGNRTANLELEGDLKEAVQYRLRGVSDILEYGVFKSGEVDKADGHNQLTSKARSWASKTGFPKRRFIPDDNQKFKRTIESGIKNILESNRVEPKFEPELTTTPKVERTPVGVSVQISDIFSDDAIENALIREIKKRRT